MPIQPSDPRFSVHPRFDLAGTKQCQDALKKANAEWEAAGGFYGPVALLTTQILPGGGIAFHWANGDLVGKISANHRIAKAVAAGQGISRVEVRNLTLDEKVGMIILRAEAWTGPPEIAYIPPPPREYIYKAGLVGEQHHRAAIDRCVTGQTVTLVHETGNPHDSQALAAVSAQGERIGYIARDHWLRRAIFEDGQGCTAVILSRDVGQRGFRQIVLEVRLGGPRVGQSVWSKDGPASVADADRISTTAMTMIAIGFLLILLVAGVIKGTHM